MFLEQPLIQRKSQEFMESEGGDDPMEFKSFLTRNTNRFAGGANAAGVGDGGCLLGPLRPSLERDGWALPPSCGRAALRTAPSREVRRCSGG
jgi:hypothetical protein